MKPTSTIFILLLTTLLMQPACRKDNDSLVSSAKSNFEQHCGGCHALPAPGLAPKDHWQQKLLPLMGGYLGMGLPPKSFHSSLDYEKVMPLTPQMDTAAWRELQAYIVSAAPAEIPRDTARADRMQPLTVFSPRAIKNVGRQPALLTSLNWDSTGQKLLVGGFRGQLLRWSAETDSEPVARWLGGSVSQRRVVGANEYVLEMGQFYPDESAVGVLMRTGPDRELPDTLAAGLQRPVDVQVADLNGDGNLEAVVCEFGYLTGRLSLLMRAGKGDYAKKTLLNVPGTLRTVVQDMNGDGRPDLLVLAAQGNEGVYILYQKEDLTFRPEQVIRLPPIYGTSSFELIDYEGDGDQDIVLVNGDNADYSTFLKPYHGLRLFINDGKNRFSQAVFIPIYGSTRVLAEDFDEDGDFDFAVTAYYADWKNNPYAGFTYLENTNSAGYDFSLHSTTEAATGRWLVMEKGDFDGDGDVDLTLGNFPLDPGETYQDAFQSWQRGKLEMLLLENQLR